MKQVKKVLSIFVLCTSMLFFSKNGQAQCSGFNVTAVQTADGSSLGDASASVSSTTGFTPSYFWYNSSYTNIVGYGNAVSGLYAGTYCVIAQDTVGSGICKDTFCITVADTGAYNCSLLQSSIYSHDTCQYNDIDFYSYASGGSGSYSFLWNTGQTTQNIYNKAGGLYTVIITDIITGCKDTLSKFEVDDTCNVCSGFNNSGYISENDGCAYNDITLTAQKWGGSYSYSYLWNIGSTSSSINNKTAGIFSCTITDNVYGCKDTLYLTVADDTCNPCSNFQANIYEMADPCGLNDVSLSAYPQDSLGSSNYTYLWNTGATTKDINNKSTGSFWVIVTNTVTGCSDSAYIYVSDDTCNPCSSFQANIYEMADSCALNDIILSAYPQDSMGSTNYTYLWNTGSTVKTLINKSAGSYWVRITNNLTGCVDTAYITVSDDTCNPCSSFQAWISENDTCKLNDITLIAESIGSSGNRSYIWNTGSTLQFLFNQSAGSYSCIISDNVYGCIDTVYKTVVDDTCAPCSNFNVIAQKLSDPCGLNNVLLGAFPFDSVNTSHYAYLWNTGATTRNISNRTSGTFWVSVTDNFTGCSDSFTFIVLDTSCNPCSSFNSYLYYTDSCSTNDLRIFANYSGGSNNISILWNTGSTSSYIENKSTGVYSVTITDNSNGCVIVDSIYAIDSNSKCCKANFNYSNNGAIVNFNSIQVGGTHSWTFGNGNTGTGATTSQTYTSGGAYTICHMINTSSNCKDTFCLTVNAPTLGRNLKVTHYGIPYIKDTPRYAYVIYQNIGTTTESGIVEYKYPAGMTLVYTSIAPLSNIGNKLIFNVGTLAPGASGSIYIMMQTPTGFALGSIKCDTAIILPISGDIAPSDNTSYECDSVVASWDPNDKIANPKGVGEAGNIDPETKEISYLINFQNEGNWRTYRVRVEDEIDPAFDINSLMIGDVSHTYRMVKTGRKIVWYFDNIELTPKSQNEKLSKGYVQYTLKLNSNLPLGTQIKNTAYIYFDANPAIITNTTKNTLKNADGNAAVRDRNQANLDFDANKLDERVVITSAEKMDAVRIYDLNGKLIVNATPKSMKAEINAELMSKQIYIIQVDMKESTVVKKFEF